MKGTKPPGPDAGQSVTVEGNVVASALAIGTGATAAVQVNLTVQGMLSLRPGRLTYRIPRLPQPYLEPSEALDGLWSLLDVDGAGPVGIVGPSAAGLLGMGGIGKSVLACALARHERASAAFPQGAVWLSFGQDVTVRDKQDELLMALSGTRHASRSIHEAHGALMLLAEQLSAPLLVVLDDVWTAGEIRTAFADLPKVHLLVTSRDRRVLEALSARPMELQLLSPDASMDLLGASAGTSRERMPVESGEVVVRCGRLPLALSAAGALIRKGIYSWSEVVEALAAARLSEFHSKWLDDPLRLDLAAVLKVSVDALPKELRECLMDFAVLQEDASVPGAALVALWSTTGRPARLARQIPRELADRSLIRSVGDDRYLIHDLYRDYLRDLAGPLEGLHGSLVARYAERCPSGWSTGPNDGYFFENLPKHLAEAGRPVADLLLDAEWLSAKVAFAGLGSAISDFGLATGREECGRVAATLKLSAARLLRAPDLLAPQLCGRLSPDQGEGIARLLAALRARAAPAVLMPSLDGFLDRPGQLLHIFRGHQGFVTAIDVSRDGRRAVSASDDGTLILWDVGTGQALRRFAGGGSGANAVAFVEHRNECVSGDERGRITVWPLDGDGPSAGWSASEGAVDSLVVLPDGWRAVSGGADGEVVVSDLLRRRVIGAVAKHRDRVTCLTALDDGTLLSGGADGEVIVSNPAGDRVIRALEGPAGRIRGLWNAGAGHVAVAGEGGTVAFFSLADGTARGRPATAPVQGQAVTLLADGMTAVSGMYDGSLRVWGLRDARPLQDIPAHGDIVSAVAAVPDGTVLSGSHDGTLRLWDIAAAAAEAPPGCGSAILALAASKSEPFLFAGCEDGFVKRLSTDRGDVIDKVHGHEGVIRSVALLRDRLCAFGGDEGVLRFWDAGGDRPPAVLPTGQGMVSKLAALGPGRVLVGGGAGSVCVWDVYSRVGTEFERRHGTTITAMAVTAGEDLAATACGDGETVVWDLARHTTLRAFAGIGSAVRGLAWLADGRRLLAGSADGVVRLLDIETGDAAVLEQDRPDPGGGSEEGAPSALIDIKVFGDPDLVALVRADNSIRIWCPRNGREVASFLDDHPMAATAVGQAGRLFAGNQVGRLHRFDASTWRRLRDLS